MTVVVIAAAAVLVALCLIEKAPAILQALADVRVAGDRSLEGLISIEEADALLVLVAEHAIRRVDPDLSPELEGRLVAEAIESAGLHRLEGGDK